MHFTCLLFKQCYANLHQAKTEAKRIKELATNIKENFHFLSVCIGLKEFFYTELRRIAESAEYTTYTKPLRSVLGSLVLLASAFDKCEWVLILRNKNAFQ